MVQGERLSAVARRRRLNEGFISASQSPKPQSEAPVLEPPHVTEQVQPISQSDNSLNSFTALAHNGLVEYSSTLKVSTVDYRSIKVQLDKNQKCLVTGSFSFWIQSGSVRVSGALLTASTDYHTVPISEDGNATVLYCLSDSTKIQLESFFLSPFARLSANGKMYENRLPDGSSIYLTFTLAGISLEPPTTNFVAANQYTSFMCRPGYEILQLTRQSSTIAKSKSSNLIICGKRFPGIEHVTREVLNALITKPWGTREAGGIIVVDLNLHEPMFTPPGIASVVHMRRPILSSTLSPSQRGSDQFIVLAMQYFGTSEIAKQERVRFEKLLTVAKEFRLLNQSCPTILFAWDVFDYLADSTLQDIQDSVDPSHIVSFGSEGDTSNRFGQALAQSACISFSSIATSSSGAYLGPRSDSLRIQQYFGLAKHHEPLVMMTQPRLQLTFGPDYESAIISAVHLEGEDIWDSFCASMLVGSIVAMILEPVELEELSGGYPQTSVSSVSNKRVIDKTPQDNNSSPFRSLQISRTVGKGLPISTGGKSKITPILHKHECIGLGIIAGILYDEWAVQLIAPVLETTLRTYLSKGHKIQLIVQQPRAEKLISG